jgi:NAD(P)-dependent dehydrogenase (short-subunit alcohol dehydrogenase family)
MTAVARERDDGLFANGLAPIARWGEPEDVGAAVAALAGGSLRYSTGEVVRVDGGMAVRRL